MENKITVSYFKCDTEKGNELFQEAKNMLETISIGEKKIEVNLQKNDPFAATEAYLCDDVVIFDGSLEDRDGGGKIGQQYDAMIEPMKSSSHVLIVSRSQIPFNVKCVRKGGYPNYIKPGVPEYKEHFDNKEIRDWIKSIFIEKNKGLFNSRKIDRRHYQSMSGPEIADIFAKVVQEDFDESEMLFGEGTKAFVSYLSRYSKHFSNPQQKNPEYTVEDLIEYISQTQGIQQVEYFPPGSISRELMTVQRRWEIVSATDDFIRKCSQFWILDTPDYKQSWWTLSELLTLSYILMKDPAKCPDIYVAKYDNENGCFRIKEYLDPESKRSFLPKIDEDTRHELARRFVNSRQGTVGYESIWIMKLMHCLPDSAIRFISRQKYKMMEEIMPTLLEDMGSMEEYETAAVASCKSDVYTNSFWNDWIMECPYCKSRSSNNYYDMKTFFDPKKSPFCHVVKKHNIKATQNTYTIICEVCKQKFHFKKREFYWWYPIRGGGIHTGPGGKSVEKKIAFHFVKKESPKST